MNVKPPAAIGEICCLLAFIGNNHGFSTPWWMSCNIYLDGKIVDLEAADLGGWQLFLHGGVVVGYPSMDPHTHGLGQSAGEEGKFITSQRPFHRARR